MVNERIIARLSLQSSKRRWMSMQVTTYSVQALHSQPPIQDSTCLSLRQTLNWTYNASPLLHNSPDCSVQVLALAPPQVERVLERKYSDNADVCTKIKQRYFGIILRTWAVVEWYRELISKFNIFWLTEIYIPCVSLAPYCKDCKNQGLGWDQVYTSFCVLS